MNTLRIFTRLFLCFILSTPAFAQVVTTNAQPAPAEKKLSFVERRLLKRTARLITESTAGTRNPIQADYLYRSMLKLLTQKPDVALQPIDASDRVNPEAGDRMGDLGKKFAAEIHRAILAKRHGKTADVDEALKKALPLYFNALILSATNGGSDSAKTHVTALAYMGLWMTSMIVGIAAKPMPVRIAAFSAVAAGVLAFYTNIGRRDGSVLSGENRHPFLPIPIWTEYMASLKAEKVMMRLFAINVNFGHLTSDDFEISQAVREYSLRLRPNAASFSPTLINESKPAEIMKSVFALVEDLSPGYFARALNRYVSCEEGLY